MRTEKNSCPQCQSTLSEEINYSDTVDFRGMVFDVENLHESKCQNCGYKWKTKTQLTKNSAAIRQAYGVIRDELRVTNGMLSGSGISNARISLGLNQREAATLFGGGYNAFNKYESGEVLQSFAMDRLLRLTKAIGKPAVEFLKDVQSPLVLIVNYSNRKTDDVVKVILDDEIKCNLIESCGSSQIEARKYILHSLSNNDSRIKH